MEYTSVVWSNSIAIAGMAIVLPSLHDRIEYGVAMVVCCSRTVMFMVPWYGRMVLLWFLRMVSLRFHGSIALYDYHSPMA